MSDILYNCLKGGFRAYFGIKYRGRQIYGSENLSSEGPAVIVSNHLGKEGPLMVAVTVPSRVYPWGISHLMNMDECVPYVRRYFVESTLRLKGRLADFVSHRIATLLVSLFNKLDVIPVYRRLWTNKGTYNIRETFKRTVGHLRQGRKVLIFPEDQYATPDSGTGLLPLKPSFALIPRYYFDETHGEGSLSVYPVAVHPEGHIAIGKPTILVDGKYSKKRIRILARLLELKIKRMYMALDGKPLSELEKKLLGIDM